MSGYLVHLGPLEMARFVCPQPRPDQILEEAVEGTVEVDFDDLNTLASTMDRQELARLIELLPPREADILEMIVLLGKRQGDIAQIFGCTQSAISSRVSRALWRLRILRDLPVFTREELQRDLEGLVIQLDLDIFWYMYETSCQMEAGRRIGLDQNRTRRRFLVSLRKLEIAAQAQPHLQRYATALGMVRDHPQVRHDQACTRERAEKVSKAHKARHARRARHR